MSTGEIDYGGRDPYWDRIGPECVVQVGPASPPQLVARRAYRPREDGLEVLIRLENKGGMMARDVEFVEPWPAFHDRPRKPQLFQVDHNIPGGGVATVGYTVLTQDPESLVFNHPVEISYWDSASESYISELAPTCDELAYEIPAVPPLVGRAEVLQRLRKHLEGLSQRGRQPGRPQAARLMMVAGRGGSGKTRLRQALVSEASRLGFQCIWDDTNDPSKVKRLLRKLLGLEPGQDRKTVIESALEWHLEDQESVTEREILINYLAGVAPSPRPGYLDDLKAQVSSVVQKMARKQRTLIIVENAQWTAEGVEQELLGHLMVSLLPSSAGAVILCVMFRPQDTDSGKPRFIEKLDRLQSDACDLIELEPFARSDIRELADLLIPLPRLSDTLIDFVFTRSQGRPLYVMELLRLLVGRGAGLLKPVLGEWQATDFNQLLEIPLDCAELIRRRVKQLSKSTQHLLRTLSVAGVDLPRTLVDNLVERYYGFGATSSLENHLDELVKTGFLVRISEEPSLTEPLDFAFEHQVKREAVLHDLSLQTHQSIRQLIVTVLMQHQGICDELEQFRQIGRHLSKAPVDFQREHGDQFLAVARAERDLSNYKRGLDLYQFAVQRLPPDSVELVQACLERAELHLKLGAFEEAQPDIDQALQLIQSGQLKSALRRRERRHILGRILKCQGKLLFEYRKDRTRANNRLRSARQKLEGPLGFRRRWPNRHTAVKDLVETYIMLAHIHWTDKGLCQEACGWAISMAEWARDNLDDSSLLPMAYIALAGLHRREPAQALEWYQRAYSSAGDDQYWQATTLCRMAEQHERMRDPEQALERFRQAQSIQEQLGDYRGLAAAYGGIGNILVERKSWEDALPICEKALSYQKLVGDHGHLWRTELSLVRIYEEQGNLRKAAQHWDEAGELLFDLGLLEQVDRSTKQREIFEYLELFAGLYEDWGDQEKAVRERRRLDANASKLIWNDNELARSFLETGEAFLRTGHFDDALGAFRNALTRLRHNAYLERSAVFEMMGDLYAQVEEEQPLDLEWAGRTDAPYDQAARHYEMAVAESATGGDHHRSLRALEKLFNHLSNEDIAIAHAVEAYLRVIERIPKDLELIEMLATRAEVILVRFERWVNAGNLLLNTGDYLAAWTSDAAADKLWYLYRRAEELYGKGSREVHAEGLSRLVQGYYRLGRIEEVVRCFLALLELRRGTGDLASYAQALGRVSRLKDRLNRAEIEEILTHAEVLLAEEESEPFSLWHVRFHTSQLLYALITGGYRKSLEVAPRQLLRAWGERARFHLEVCIELADTDPQLAAALNDDGLVLGHFGASEQASERFKRSLDMKRRMGNDRGYATTAHNLACLFFGKRNEKNALTLLREAIKIRERIVQSHDNRLTQRDFPLSAEEVAQIRWDKRCLANSLETLGRYLTAARDPDGQALCRRAKRLLEEADRGLSGTSDAKHSAAFDWTHPSGGDPSWLPGDDPGDFSNRRTSVLSHTCPVCGGSVDPDSWACQQCNALVCLVCGRAVGEDDVVCPNCGTEQPIFCTECGTQIHTKDTVCPTCGEPLVE